MRYAPACTNSDRLGEKVKKDRIQKIQFQAVCLFRKDGWRLCSRWRGWFPEVDRFNGKFETYYSLRIGPMRITLDISR